MKNKPEQTRLFEETHDEKVEHARRVLEEMEKSLAERIRDWKSLEKVLAEFVATKYDGDNDIWKLSEDDRSRFVSIACELCNLRKAILASKSCVGTAATNLAEAERSR